MYKTRILVNNRAIPTYHDREGNIWVEARYGTKYAIEVKNDTWKRALAVVSVDGLNVINGKRKEPTKSIGYIVSSYNNVIIKGWRISSKEVKEFYFTKQEDSYSKKLGADLSNTGVIGCVIYEEVPESVVSTTYHHEPFYPYLYPYFPYEVRHDANGDMNNVQTYSCSIGRDSVSDNQMELDFSSHSLSKNVEKMATGSGEKIRDHSHKRSFGKKIWVASMNIYYGSHEELVQRGVIRDGYRDELPKPFPNEGSYCPNV